MSNSLMIYLNKRLKEETLHKKNPAITAGPVITISREVGCNGLKLANQIAEKLNQHKSCLEWKILSKEIFYESAKELNLEPERIKRIFKQTDKYTFEEILKAFGEKQFKSERRIIRTVADVIRSFAIDGYCIIVGRAGHIIACDIKNALHLRLVAPLEYRIQVIMENKKISQEAAAEFIQRVEKERIAFRKAIFQVNQAPEIFDLMINRASFKDDEILEIIKYAVKEKIFLKSQRAKMEFF